MGPTGLTKTKKRMRYQIVNGMHKVAITADNCNVLNEALEEINSTGKIGSHRFGASKLEYSNNANTLKLNLENGTVVMQLLRTSSKRWTVKWISADLQRLSFGHSGKDIDTQSLLNRSIARLDVMLNIVLDPGSQHCAIPGIGKSRSYWSSLELNVDIDDRALPEHLGEVGTRCLSLYSNAKLGRNRRAPYVRKGESIKFDGKELCLRIYNKSKHLMDRYCFSNEIVCPSIFRIEFEVKGAKLPNIAGLTDREKLQTFTISEAYGMFIKLHGTVKGAFWANHGGLRLTKLESSIATAAGMAEEVSVEDLANTVYENPKSKSNALSRIRKYMEVTSKVMIQDVLQENYNPGYSVPAIIEHCGSQIRLDSVEFQRSLNLVQNTYTEISGIVSTSPSSPLYDATRSPYHYN